MKIIEMGIYYWQTQYVLINGCMFRTYSDERLFDCITFGMMCSKINQVEIECGWEDQYWHGFSCDRVF